MNLAIAGASVSYGHISSLNMEFAFKNGNWEFLIHDLTPETQLLAAIGYGTDLYVLCIISCLTEQFCDF